jgi:NADPH:quinone reductase-like Zn-dependent oxidoreductase
MRAITLNKYGSPDFLRLDEVMKPTPKPNEVLVKVHAASINSWDWDALHGRPWVNRLIFGLFSPGGKILGCDIAGVVEDIGSKVKDLRVGDAVFGDISGSGFGAFAEYVCARADVVAKKPEAMTFEQAVAIPQAGVLALQGLRDTGKMPADASGIQVLINGAGGGVGSFAIPMAKQWGADVVGVDRTDKLELMRSLGADHVVDYRKTDFTATGKRYDLILDVVANRPLAHFRRALKPGGLYVIAGGISPVLLKTFLFGWIGGRKVKLLMHKPNRGDLEAMVELFDAGIRPVIDRSYPLSEVPEAMRYFGTGGVQGKVVILVNEMKVHDTFKT